MLIIDHGDGYMTLYCHNQGLNAGQLIAAAGKTGGRMTPGGPVAWLRTRG